MRLSMIRAQDATTLRRGGIDSEAIEVRRVVSRGQKSEYTLEKPNVTPNHAGTQEGQGKDEAEVARLTDVLTTGATGDSTRKEYNGRVKTFANMRAVRGK